jgi:hypothetical protein
MMRSMVELGATGWLMIAAHAGKLGIVALLGAAAIKYLFFADRGVVGS